MHEVILGKEGMLQSPNALHLTPVLCKSCTWGHFSLQPPPDPKGFPKEKIASLYYNQTTTLPLHHYGQHPGFRPSRVFLFTPGQVMNSMKPVIPLNIHCTGQFTPKMKANAKPCLLSSLVWIDAGVVMSQYRLESFFHEIKCNGMTIKFHGIDASN